MGWLVNLVIGWGVPKEAAKVVAFVMLALAAVLLLWGAKAAYDAAVVDEAFDEVEAEQAKADREADREAGEQRREDDTRLAQEQQELKDVLNQNGLDPATRKREFYRCLRLQQAARQNGLEPPACN